MGLDSSQLAKETYINEGVMADVVLRSEVGSDPDFGLDTSLFIMHIGMRCEGGSCYMPGPRLVRIQNLVWI